MKVQTSVRLEAVTHKRLRAMSMLKSLPAGRILDQMIAAVAEGDPRIDNLVAQLDAPES